MPVIANPNPSWMNPQNASVFDSPVTKGLRAAGNLIGANDPNQVMGVAAGLNVPGGEGGVLDWLSAKLGGKTAAKAVQGLSRAHSAETGPLPSVDPPVGSYNPDFTPVGGENLYNSTQGVSIPKPPQVDAYKAGLARLLASKGAPP